MFMRYVTIEELQAFWLSRPLARPLIAGSQSHTLETSQIDQRLRSRCAWARWRLCKPIGHSSLDRFRCGDDCYEYRCVHR